MVASFNPVRIDLGKVDTELLRCVVAQHKQFFQKLLKYVRHGVIASSSRSSYSCSRVGCSSDAWTNRQLKRPNKPLTPGFLSVSPPYCRRFGDDQPQDVDKIACLQAPQQRILGGEIRKRKNLPKRAAKMGEYLLGRLWPFRLNRPNGGNEQVKWPPPGIKLVKDKVSKAPVDDARVAVVLRRCVDQNFFIGSNANTLPGRPDVLFAPALSVSLQRGGPFGGDSAPGDACAAKPLIPC